MVVLAQLAERQIVALEVKGSTPLDHPIFTLRAVTYLTYPILIGVSPSGKASDSDSDIRGFKSYHPSQKQKKLDLYWGVAKR